MADISNNNNSQQDIIDNLLVKEETGNLHYFQDKDNQTSGQSLANLSTNKAIINDADSPVNNDQEIIDQEINDLAIAPKDDNFSSNGQIQGEAKDKSELIFHPEDKNQIDRLLESVPIDDSKKYSIEKIIDKLLNKQVLVLDNNNKALFTNLILDFFRNRKSVISLRELLATKIISKEKTVSAEVVDSILSVVKSLKNKIDSEGGLVVGIEDIKKEEFIKVTPIKDTLIKKEEKSEDTKELGEPESNIFLNKEEKIPEINKGTLAEVKIKSEEKETLELENQFTEKKVSPENSIVNTEEAAEVLTSNEEDELIPSIKFGVQPKGVNEDEPLPNPEMKEENKTEIDASLAEIKDIIPNMTINGAEGNESKEEEELLKNLTIDTNTDGRFSESRQDLHDIGQLMTEDDVDKNDDIEDDVGGFVIKKIKPAVAVGNVSITKDEVSDNNKKIEDKIGNNKDLEQKPEEVSVLKKSSVPDIDAQVNQVIEKPEAVLLPKVIRPTQTFSIKPKISDVQEVANGAGVKHVLTGPVDEIGGMTLKNFRFLGADAESRKNKILEKINLLEQDSYTKKAAGIKAWRQSPVNRLYLQLGAESMTAGKEVSVLINDKKIAKEITLDMEEFSAISDLNKSLRF